MRLMLAMLSFLLPAAAAYAEGPTAPPPGEDRSEVARTAVIGREFGTELLRYSAGSPVFLGSDGTLPVVIIADPRRDSGDQPNPDLFRRSLPGCRPGDGFSCCFDNGGSVPPSQWYLTLYGWINSSKVCTERLDPTPAPADIRPPLADEIVRYAGIDNMVLTTAGVRGLIRVLYVHDSAQVLQATCGSPRYACVKSKDAPAPDFKCALSKPSGKSGIPWASQKCPIDSKLWLKLPDRGCTCSH